MARIIADLVIFALVAALSFFVGWALRDARAKAEYRVLSARVEQFHSEARGRDERIYRLEQVREQRDNEWNTWMEKEPTPAPLCLVTAPVWDPKWLARHRLRSEEGKGGK